MKKPVISPEQSLTFADYFKLNADIEDILEYFGYAAEIAPLSLPRSNRQPENIADLQARLEENILLVTLTSEIARREFLIAPVLSEVKHYTRTKIRVEYAIEVTHQLKGNFDYLLRGKSNLLIVEAKNADLKRGMTQLAVELIALDKAEETNEDEIFGAVSIGNSWQFGKLNRSEKIFTEDLNFFAVPQNLADLMSVLIGLLENEN